MSYDVSVGGWDGNYTHNSLGQLCYKHLCKEHGLQSLRGLTGTQAKEKLSDFWESIHTEKLHLWQNGAVGEPALCAQYDSPNGWGSLVGALIFMGELTAACAMYPRNKIEVDA